MIPHYSITAEPNIITKIVYRLKEIESNSKFWHTPNIVITPHVSSDDNGNYVKMTLDLFMKNLKLFLENKELENQIDKNLGY